MMPFFKTPMEGNWHWIFHKHQLEQNVPEDNSYLPKRRKTSACKMGRGMHCSASFHGDGVSIPDVVIWLEQGHWRIKSTRFLWTWGYVVSDWKWCLAWRYCIQCLYCGCLKPKSTINLEDSWATFTFPVLVNVLFTALFHRHTYKELLLKWVKWKENNSF